MTVTDHQQRVDPIQTHRRAVRRFIVLPVGGAVVLILGMAIASAAFLSPRGLSIVANSLFSCLCLLPIVLCLSPLYIGAIVAAITANRLETLVTDQVRRVRGLTEQLMLRTATTTDNINQRTLETSVKITPATQILFGAFDRQTPTDGKPDVQPEQ